MGERELEKREKGTQRKGRKGTKRRGERDLEKRQKETEERGNDILKEISTIGEFIFYPYMAQAEIRL